MQITAKIHNSYGHWDSFLDLASFIRIVHPMIHSCLLSKSAENDFIGSKTKKTLKSTKDQVSNQIHAISEGLRTCVANFSTE